MLEHHHAQLVVQSADQAALAVKDACREIADAARAHLDCKIPERARLIAKIAAHMAGVWEACTSNNTLFSIAAGFRRVEGDKLSRAHAEALEKDGRDAAMSLALAAAWIVDAAVAQAQSTQEAARA